MATRVSTAVRKSLPSDTRLLAEIEALKAKIAEQAKAVKAKAKTKAKAKAKDEDEDEDDPFLPMWRVNGSDYCSAIVEAPSGEKFWINIFPNRYWKEKKDVIKGHERPMVKYTINPYTPSKKARRK